MLFHRRDVMHKRVAQNGARLDLAARARPAVPSPADTPNITAGSPSDNSEPAKATDPLISTTPDPKTSDTPTNPFSSPNPLVPTPTVAFPPHSSLSSSSTPTGFSTSDSKFASATSSATSVPTSVTAALSATLHVPSLTTKVVGVPFTPSSTLSSTLSPSTTSSAGSSNGTNTAAIVGGVAGTLAGIAVLGFLLMWCMRRQRNRDIDDFDAQAFRRQSAILVDDLVEPSRSYNPRPPTMIERHNASPALAAQAGFGGHNYYGSYGGYGQQAPYASEMIQPSVSPPLQVYGSSPMGYTGFNDPQQQNVRPSNAGHAAYAAQQQPTRQPSNAAYLTRQPGSAPGYVPPAAPPGSLDPNAHYINLDRSSISPYQAAQYADISRQLNATDAKTELPAEPVELPEGPLPSPFDDPAPATLFSHVNQDPQGSSTTAPTPQTQHSVTEPQQRPATVYGEDDAYGGI